VDNDHAKIVKPFNEKANVLVKGLIERQLGKKRMNVSNNVISKKILSKVLCKRMMIRKKTFVGSWSSNCEKSMAIEGCRKSLV
jgi:hypothetical protein